MQFQPDTYVIFNSWLLINIVYKYARNIDKVSAYNGTTFLKMYHYSEKQQFKQIFTLLSIKSMKWEIAHSLI